jgi:hypothetical protein
MGEAEAEELLVQLFSHKCFIGLSILSKMIQ